MLMMMKKMKKKHILLCARMLSGSLYGTTIVSTHTSYFFFFFPIVRAAWTHTQACCLLCGGWKQITTAAEWPTMTTIQLLFAHCSRVSFASHLRSSIQTNWVYVFAVGYMANSRVYSILFLLCMHSRASTLTKHVRMNWFKQERQGDRVG